MRSGRAGGGGWLRLCLLHAPTLWRQAPEPSHAKDRRVYADYIRTSFLWAVRSCHFRTFTALGLPRHPPLRVPCLPPPPPHTHTHTTYSHLHSSLVRTDRRLCPPPPLHLHPRTGRTITQHRRGTAIGQTSVAGRPRSGHCYTPTRHSDPRGGCFSQRWALQNGSLTTREVQSEGCLSLESVVKVTGSID